MTEQHDRLRLARESAGYGTRADAAAAMGVKAPTYVHHENGTNKLSRSGRRYAKFFRVRYEWLMNGEGPMRGLDQLSCAETPSLLVPGFVGAGGAVDWADEIQIDAAHTVTFPTLSEIIGLIVKGDSQYPRFLDGEIVLVSRKPETPASLIGQYAIVKTSDGRKMIKMLRRSASQKNTFCLHSHNAPDEDGVRVEAAWRYLGCLPRRRP